MDNSPFGKLSPELRNRIYRLCVTFDEIMRIGLPRSQDSGNDPFGHDTWLAPLGAHLPATQPAITRACRQIRSESLLMFYANNSFVVDIPSNDQKPAEAVRRPNLRPLADRHESHVKVLSLTIKSALMTARKWLNDMPSCCHRAIRCLTIKVVVIHDWDTLFNWTGIEWRRLARTMKDYGYSESRNKVDVFFSGGSLENGEKTSASARNDLKALGLEACTWTCFRRVAHIQSRLLRTSNLPQYLKDSDNSVYLSHDEA